MSTVFSIRLSDKMATELAAVAERQGVRPSAMIIEFIDQALGGTALGVPTPPAPKPSPKKGAVRVALHGPRTLPTEVKGVLIRKASELVPASRGINVVFANDVPRPAPGSMLLEKKYRNRAPSRHPAR